MEPSAPHIEAYQFGRITIDGEPEYDPLSGMSLAPTTL